MRTLMRFSRSVAGIGVAFFEGVAGTLAALLLLTAGLGIIAWRQKQETQRHLDRAKAVPGLFKSVGFPAGSE